MCSYEGGGTYGEAKVRGFLSHSDFVGAGTAGLELAVLALEDVPVRAGVAHGADPLDERGLRLEEGKGVVAVARDGHGFEMSEASSGGGL